MKRIKLNPVDVFDIQNLPDVPFRRVLYFLSVKDTRNLRLLSKWFEMRITFLRKSIFNKFHIKGINEGNCVKIRRALPVAMNKLNAPEKLELQFKGEMNKTMEQITADYKDNITSLDISAYYSNVDLLLQPSFQFKCLDSLTLSCFYYNDDKMFKAFEVLLDKYANNLRNLNLKDLTKNLRVPNLPKLDSLSLSIQADNAKEVTLTILEQCRPTITRLELATKRSVSFREDESNNSLYQIPNIKHLNIRSFNAFPFAIVNAEHLVSLEFDDFYCKLPNDMEWPQFPNLRELSICDSKLKPILMNCKETLELLVLEYVTSFDDDYATLVMPRLTDLYLSNTNSGLTSKICSYNHKSLEFLFLRDTKLPNLEGDIRMESMRNVVLGHNYPNYTARNRERMGEMCPNAEVFLLRKKNKSEIRDLIKSRCINERISVRLLYVDSK